MNRIGDVVPETNFGVIQIDWNKKELALQLYDNKDALRVKQKVAFSALGF